MLTQGRLGPSLLDLINTIHHLQKVEPCYSLAAEARIGLIPNLIQGPDSAVFRGEAADGRIEWFLVSRRSDSPRESHRALEDSNEQPHAPLKCLTQCICWFIDMQYICNFVGTSLLERKGFPKPLWNWSARKVQGILAWPVTVRLGGKHWRWWNQPFLGVKSNLNFVAN